MFDSVRLRLIDRGLWLFELPEFLGFAQDGDDSIDRCDEVCLTDVLDAV